MVYFSVRRNVKFGVPNTYPCANFDVKSGLRVVKLVANTVFSVAGSLEISGWNVLVHLVETLSRVCYL